MQPLKLGGCLFQQLASHNLSKATELRVAKHRFELADIAVLKKNKPDYWHPSELERSWGGSPASYCQPCSKSWVRQEMYRDKQ